MDFDDSYTISIVKIRCSHHLLLIFKYVLSGALTPVKGKRKL